MSLCVAPVVLAVSLTSAFAAGEDTTLPLSLTPGTRIRIQAPEVFHGKVIGTVSAANADSVTIDVPGRSEPLANGGRGSHIVSNGAVTAACAVLGAVVGAVIGVAVPPGEHWKPVAANRYRVSFVPTLDHGLDMAFALKF
jgi:hypothetical protein